jgi:hypothetical protein
MVSLAEGLEEPSSAISKKLPKLIRLILVEDIPLCFKTQQ